MRQVMKNLLGTPVNCDHSNERCWAISCLVALFIMLYKVVLTFDSNFFLRLCALSNWAMFPVVLFCMLYKVVNWFVRRGTLKCDHSNKSYWAVLSCGAVYYAVQGDSNFWGSRWDPKVWPFKWKLLSSTFCGTVYFAVQGGSTFNYL